MRNKEIASLGPSVTLILVNITAMAADLLRFAFAGQERSSLLAVLRPHPSLIRF